MADTEAELEAENARLRAAERRHRAILESAVDFAIIATDRDGRVSDWNTGAERILGWSAEDMQGQTADRIFTPEDRAENRPGIEMRRALDTGRANDERWHMKRDGSRFWASGELMPLRGEDGAHLGFLKILRDRTEQRQAAAKQRADAEFLHSILASSGDCIKVLDLDARLIFMSEGGQRVMEVSDFNAIRGCSWPDFWHDEGNTQARAAVAAAKAGGTGHFQGPANTMAGTPRYWDVQVTPIPGADGQPEKLLSISRDISALRRAQVELKELNDALEQRVVERTRAARFAEARFRGIFDSTYQLISLVALDGTLLEVNRAALDAAGIDAAGAVGLAFWATPWFRRTPEAMAALQVALPAAASGQFIRTEFDLLLPDDRVRTYDFSLSPVRNEQDDVVFIVAEGRDITQLRATEEHLRQSQKMEAVGQLTGGLAHDFNNLLTGVMGSLELLQTRMAQGRMGELERYIAAAQGASKRAAALTHRLLAFSRRQTLDPKPTDVNRLVADMEELIRRTMGPEVAIEVVAAGGLWATLVDPNQLENALLNLCINARDAMAQPSAEGSTREAGARPGGGRLTIETANCRLDEQAARERDLPPGQYVSLSVRDSGAGMTPDVIARAFDPFFTTKPIGMGTGLGLSMIYGFVRQSGGQAHIHSQPGQGATVCLHLPRHLGEAEAAQEPDERAEPSRAEAGETVLVVDDEPTVRMLVTAVLEDLGYTAIEAADGAAGLRVLQSNARVDLLVTDVGLPGGLNGRQVADAGRAVRPDLKVLFITGYAENAVLGHGHLDPGMHVLTKPFAMEALASRIKGLIARP